MKRPMTLLVSLVAMACGSSMDPASEAALFVAEDLVSRTPDTVRSYFGSEWETGSRVRERMPDPLLARLTERTGLPVASPEMVSGGDAPMAVLYLFRPNQVAGDTLHVMGGWVGFPLGDEPAGWGEEYEYLLACRPRCLLVSRSGPRPVR